MAEVTVNVTNDKNLSALTQHFPTSTTNALVLSQHNIIISRAPFTRNAQE